MLLSALTAVLISAAQPTQSGTYAVLDIANEQGQQTALSSYIGDELSLRYASDSGYSLVERGQLKKVLKEHNLQATGAIDEATVSSLGKFLGASRIITGQYYQMGDEYVAMVRVLDVSTGKVLKMAKVNFPKSSSTQALAQTILQGAQTTSQITPEATPNQSGNIGPITLDKCVHNYGTTCYGTLVSPVKGRLDIPQEQALFFYDDGILGKFVRFQIAGTEQIFDVPAGTKVPVQISFTGSGKRFRDFKLKYTFAGKEYLIEGPRPIEN